jgi:hypothetical protein
MGRAFTLIAASAALAAALGGCGPVYLQGKYDYEEGWREGVVTRLGEGEEITVHATVDCRSELSADRMRKTRFALVRFNSGRNQYSQVVALANPAAVAVGDAMLVKMDDCSQPGLPFSRK